jgi:hypothetical protein
MTYIFTLCACDIVDVYIFVWSNYKKFNFDKNYMHHILGKNVYNEEFKAIEKHVETDRHIMLEFISTSQQVFISRCNLFSR